MSEEKQCRIKAAVALDEEATMEETDTVLDGEGTSEYDCTCLLPSEQGEEPEQCEDEAGKAEEPANWVGRLPLSRSLALWQENRDTERFVALRYF